eukprot:Hpha_TRINITY_DN15249_c3_g4::TRINITY_DN15249_c3_g4_i1::g.65001::m.65001
MSDQSPIISPHPPPQRAPPGVRSPRSTVRSTGSSLIMTPPPKSIAAPESPVPFNEADSAPPEPVVPISAAASPLEERAEGFVRPTSAPTTGRSSRPRVSLFTGGARASFHSSSPGSGDFSPGRGTPQRSPRSRRRTTGGRGSGEVSPEREQGRAVYKAVLAFESLAPDEYMRKVLADSGPMSAPVSEALYQYLWRHVQAVDRMDGTGEISSGRLEEYLQSVVGSGTKKGQDKKGPEALGRLRQRLQQLREEILMSIPEGIHWALPLSVPYDKVTQDLTRLASCGRLVRRGYRAPRPSLWKHSAGRFRRSVSAVVGVRRFTRLSSVGSVAEDGVLALRAARQLGMDACGGMHVATTQRAAHAALDALLEVDAGLPPGAGLPPECIPSSSDASRQLGTLLTAVDLLRPRTARERLGSGDSDLCRLLLLAGARHQALGHADDAGRLFDEARALKSVPPELAARSVASAACAASARGMRGSAAAGFEESIEHLRVLSTSRGGLCGAEEVLLHYCEVALGQELLARGDVKGALESYTSAKSRAEKEPQAGVYHSAGRWNGVAVAAAEEGISQVLETEGHTLQALRTCRELQRQAEDAVPQRAATMHSRAGRLYAVHGMLEKATEEYERAVDRAREGHLGVQLEMGLRLGLGDTLKKRKMLREAKTQYECAIGLSRQLNDPRAQGWALLRGGLNSQEFQISLEKQKMKQDAEWEGQRAFAALSQADELFETCAAPPATRARTVRALAELLNRTGNLLQAADQHDRESAFLLEANQEQPAQKAKDQAEKLRRNVEQQNPSRRRRKN